MRRIRRTTLISRPAATWTICGWAVFLVACLPSLSLGQRARNKMPEVERLTVMSKDGVLIRCNYYPGGVIERSTAAKKGRGEEKKKSEKEYTTVPGKEVVPVILLHGWNGRRSTYDFLASFLQKQGHAVIVPDLRGHGDSTTVRLASGNQRIRRDRMRANDFRAMIYDVDAVKRFLLKRNNAVELNIELLCVVGAELGAILAVNWAQHDWSWRQLPSFKQGQDVKALVLLSPEQSFKGYTLRPALQHPIVRARLSVMIIAGQRDRERHSDAKKIFNRLEKFHSEPEDPSQRDLYFLEPDVALHGTQLVDQRVRLPVLPSIGVFINRRLVANKELLEWRERKSPLGSAD